ncbi:MAG: hypothetical protein L0G89_01095 [Janibacter sp.]|nr:hypothetical protein [Janibacter sp.]
MTQAESVPSLDSIPPVRRKGRRHLGAGAVAVATLVSNVLGYALFLVLNRELTSDDLGAVASLLNLITIASVAALSTQLVSAWRVARQRVEAEATALRTGFLVGLIVTAVVIVLTPALVPLLHLDGLTPVLLVATLMVPTCVIAAVLGVLQGAEKFVALAALYVVVGSSRAVGGAAAAWLGWGVSGVMALTSVAAWLVLPAALWHVRDQLRRSLQPALPTQVGRVLAGVAGTSALLVASAIDTPVARHVLSGDDSGDYAVVSVFAKAAFWGPAFLATVLYARMSRARAERAFLLALSGTGVIVAMGIVVSSVLDASLIRIVGGAGYTHLAGQVPLFTALGGAWALIQVLVFWGAARGRHAVGYLVWTGVGIATLVVLLAGHESVASIAATYLVAAALVLLIGVVLGFPRRSSRTRDLSEPRRTTSAPLPR